MLIHLLLELHEYESLLLRNWGISYITSTGRANGYMRCSSLHSSSNRLYLQRCMSENSRQFPLFFSEVQCNALSALVLALVVTQDVVFAEAQINITFTLFESQRDHFIVCYIEKTSKKAGYQYSERVGPIIFWECHRFLWLR